MKILATTAFALALGVSGIAGAQTSSGATGAGACQPGTAACQGAATGSQSKDGASGSGMSGKVQGEAKGQEAQPQDKAEGASDGSAGAPIKGQSEAQGTAGQDQAGKAGSGDPKQAGTSDCKAGDPNCSKQDAQSGQATGEQKPATEQRAGEQDQKSDTQQRAGEQPEKPTESQAQGSQPAQTDGDSGATASIPDVNITTEQKTEIKQIITTEKVEPVTVDVDVSVGVVVPRTVEVHRLPPRIVKLVPAYSEYAYFVLADGRIVVVEPDTYKVVVIIA